MQTERRKHRRLDISLPISFSTTERAVRASESATTTNVSTGGVYFCTDLSQLEPGALLDLELTIPPGQGHFPYEGRISGQGVVVRVDPLNEDPPRWGVAAQFRNPPKLAFGA